MDGLNREEPSAAIHLRLYVAGGDVRSVEARRLGEQVIALCRQCQLEIVDVLDDPAQAERDRVLATPMLVRLEPPPLVRLIGGLWSTEFVMEALQLDATKVDET